MRLILTDPAATRVVVALQPDRLAYALANEAWLGLTPWWTESLVYEGDVAPSAELRTEIDRARPEVLQAEDLFAYANRRRKEIAEGAGAQPGRLVPVTIASGTYRFPIDATTRAALGDAAFQTTLPGGESYRIESWLLPTGAFIAMDATSIMTVAKAVAADFQAVFDAQRQAFAAILSGTATTRADVDAILGS